MSTVEISRRGEPAPERSSGRTTSPGRPNQTGPAPGSARGGAAQLLAAPIHWVRSGGLTTLLFALPMIIGFTIFGWWPIINGVLLSFQDTNLITTEWVGLANILDVLQDPLLKQAILNTLLYAVLAILFGFPIPLLAAATISEFRGRGRQFASILAFLPVVIPPVVAILLWKRFYSVEDTGLFNTVIGWFGAEPIGWLQNPAWSMPSLVLAATWAGAGSTVIIYLAAMVTIDRELYDAAEVDGAGIWRRVWNIMIPQLRGTILVLLLLQIIGVFQVFAEPYILTNGGPENRTVTLLMLVYRRFLKSDYGGAAALSLLLALVLAVLSALYLQVTKRWAQ